MSTLLLCSQHTVHAHATTNYFFSTLALACLMVMAHFVYVGGDGGGGGGIFVLIVSCHATGCEMTVVRG